MDHQFTAGVDGGHDERELHKRRQVPTADVQEFQRRGRTVPQLVVQQSFDGEKETEQVRIGGEMVRPLVGGNGMLRQFFQAIEENDGTNDLLGFAVGGDKKFHRFLLVVDGMGGWGRRGHKSHFRPL